MFEISNDGIIRVSRGDNFEVPLFINKGTDICPLRFNIGEHPNAEVYLAVMQPNQLFEQAIIKKKYTKEDINKHGDVLVKFKHNDTACLYPGKYYYEIKLVLNDEEVITVISKKEFWIV